MLVEELRYPFWNALHFFIGGFFAEPAALHLTLGWIALIGCMAALLVRERNLVRVLTIFYFATALFTNPAYIYGWLRFSELAGAAGAALGVWDLYRRRAPLPRITFLLLLLTLVLAVHAVVVDAFYDVNPGDSNIRARGAIIAKIAVLALMIGNVVYFSREQVLRLIRFVTTMAGIACALYFVQLLLWLVGVRSYGTFESAGLTGIPSFGSVSIERGHFGRFLVTLFPVFILDVVLNRGRTVWAGLFFAGSVANFSASSLAYLFVYSVTALALFARAWITRARILVPVSVVLFGVGLTYVLFRTSYMAVWDKIYSLGILGSDRFGRSLSILQAYLDQFPLGTSYGGSVLRNMMFLPEINFGLYVGIAQLSVLVIGFWGILLYAQWRVVTAARRPGSGTLHRIGVVALVGYWTATTADALWFIPALWLPFAILSSFSRQAASVQTNVISFGPVLQPRGSQPEVYASPSSG